MLTILSILVTWYAAKLYYTKDPVVRFPESDDNGLMTAKCNKCSQHTVISKEDMRNPFYCMRCK